MSLKKSLIALAMLLLLGAIFLFLYNTNLPVAGAKQTGSSEALKAMCSQLKPGNRYNDKVAFYVDLQQYSGRYRFFVLDLKNQQILHKGMVLNGREKDDQPVYSNVPGSKCSSRGLAKIGYAYHGRFGRAYKLVGLDATNSNMMARAVVLHSWRGVPNMQVPFRLPNSEGCPAVSTRFMEILSGYIDKSSKPILLYIN
ncbi:L,D-transpeptidase catalytic domain [Cnuella takakiae]|uniref:L,D-transpeptidase catalytic domain n=1 Tax=Cnuella takakiae TaxID=1302690 RepID=A0A1M5AGZ9_9BACT|nr:murein L,D-transpeptidase catalytic domain family protein [Cnuella takakiae]OLY91964.1 hypothetical protein BUE76_08700 [Cnuella takakiae]SHF29538.1 L,D-transpeptidase catalytic domain [Cnuella takakiae]